MRKSLVISLLFIIFISFAIAQEYSIDISLDTNNPINVGEELPYTIRLVDGTTPISDNVEVIFSDVLGKKEIKQQVKSNEENFLEIGNYFPSGLWNIKAIYQDLSAEAVFTIAENTEINILIEENKLIIRNNGNQRYTETIYVKIGDKISSKTLNIASGDEKQWQLIAPDGSYDIEITDSQNKPLLTKRNIQLYGTGNAVGAIDTDLVGYAGLGGAEDPDNLESSIFSSDKLLITTIFVGAVFVLGVLYLIERIVSNKKSKKSKKK